MDAADLDRFLAEDIGAGDITTLALVDAGIAMTGVVRAREACIVAGVDEACAVFGRLGVRVERAVDDGAAVTAGTVVLRVEGEARDVLTAERLALNFLMRMSGIATLTHDVQSRIAAVNPACRVAATRKTTPGFRTYEKRAVTLGGGDPHRFGLSDAFLVKDNHLAAGVSITDAVRRCRALDGTKPVEVEADTVEQAVEAAAAGADMVLLDNFRPADAAKAAAEVRRGNPKVRIECSGGIRPETAHEWAHGADRVSLGRLTLDAPSVDFGLDS